jgi:two-component system, LuxR family, response regulator FixJ
MPSKQVVFVVDDEEAVRDSIRLMLERRHDAVKAFASADDFLAAYRPDSRGCLVCDVRLKSMSGLDLHRRLVEMGSDLPVILITGHGDIEMAVAAVKRGAFDFIEKPFDDVVLYASVMNALKTDRELIAKDEALAGLRARIAELSDRQREVMELLIDGLSNKEIGQRLGISPRTVETYRAFVMAKTGASSLAELVKMSIRAGMRD